MADDDLLELSEGELAALIKASDRDHVVSVVRGVNKVWLKWRESKWALTKLAKIRGIAAEPMELGE